MKIKTLLIGTSLALAGLITACASNTSTGNASAKPISAEFPFAPNYMDVLGSKMFYVDETAKNPSTNLTFLYLHGNPTSSYLWRNIIPYTKPLGRSIAVDLIGMGRSDKPELDYTFQDHRRYLDEFIKKMKLKNVVLVIHDWGSGLGFDYARRHPKQIKGIVFMEAIYKPIFWKDAPFQERMIFKIFRHPTFGPKLIGGRNFFVKRFIPMAIVRKLSKKEHDAYKKPFLTRKSRKPVVVWPSQIPIDGAPPAMKKIVGDYNAWLKTSDVPKLMLYVKPGMIIGEKQRKEIEATFKNLTSVFVGQGKHYVQEDNPHGIGAAIQNWILKRNAGR